MKRRSQIYLAGIAAAVVMACCAPNNVPDEPNNEPALAIEYVETDSGVWVVPTDSNALYFTQATNVDTVLARGFASFEAYCDTAYTFYVKVYGDRFTDRCKTGKRYLPKAYYEDQHFGIGAVLVDSTGNKISQWFIWENIPTE